MCDFQTNLKRLLECVSKNDIEGVTKWTNKGLDPNFNTCGTGGNSCWVSSLIVSVLERCRQSIVTREALFILHSFFLSFFFIPFSTDVKLASAPWKQVWSNWNFNTKEDSEQNGLSLWLITFSVMSPILLRFYVIKDFLQCPGMPCSCNGLLLAHTMYLFIGLRLLADDIKMS